MHKTDTTSRHSGLTSQRFRGFMSQRRNVETNVATFQKDESATSRRWILRESINPTSRRSRRWCQLTLQRWGQRSDIPEGVQNRDSQRRDVEIQRHDVTYA